MPKQSHLYRLYKRGEIYHAYFSFIQDGERIQFRETTGASDKQQAEEYCLNRLKKFQALSLHEYTLDEAFGRFFEENGKYQAYPHNLKLRLKVLLKGLGGDTKLNHITPNLISQYVAKRKFEVKNGTINRELTDLIAVINTARDKWQKKVPDFKISIFKLKEPAENVKYLKNWDEAQKIIDNASPHLKPIIYTALYTGLRLGNILNLKWGNIDFDNKKITLKVKDRTTEGGKILTIPLIKNLEEILNNIPRINDFCFNYRGKPIKSIKTAWKNCFKNNMQYVNFHTLRHTCATWLLRETHDLKIVKEIMGHAEIKTTLKYSHILDDDKRKALDSLFSQNLHKI